MPIKKAKKKPHKLQVQLKKLSEKLSDMATQENFEKVKEHSATITSWLIATGAMIELFGKIFTKKSQPKKTKPSVRTKK